MKKFFLVFLSLIMGVSLLIAQPHLTGELAIDMEKGYFECQFTLSNIPDLETYKILLNKGMNVKSFEDAEGNPLHYDGFYDGKIQGEALAYSLVSPENDPLDLPASISIEYVGAFPRYTNDYNLFDFKGLIAINDQTLRATEQTKWYPVIYDELNDRQINSYTYDLNISVAGATTVFINGSAPRNTTGGQFTSAKAYPLLLLVGNYNFLGHEDNYILNDTLTDEQAEQVFRNVSLIKAKLVKILDRKFEDKIFLIKHKAVNQRRKGSSWGFNTYPAFAFTGIKFSELVEENERFSDNMLRYFGHEFGHNYFGNNVLSGKYSWFWLESFPEYLSFRIAEELVGMEYLKQVLSGRTADVENGEFVPLDQVQDRKEINESYRYSLGPLLLKTLEHIFGKAKMDLLMKELLDRASGKTLDLEDLREAALKSGIDEAAYREFEREFILDENFKENILAYIKKHFS